MPTSALAQVGAAAVVAAAWTGRTVGSEYAVDFPGPIGEAWYSPIPDLACLALGIGLGYYVGRYVVLLVALPPLVALVILGFRGHIAPWHDSEPVFTELFVRGGIIFFLLSTLGPPALGVFLRRKREQRRGWTPADA